MKLLTIFAVALIGVWGCSKPSSHADEDYGNDTTVEITIDSATYADQKLALVTEINHLLDSINLTIDHVDGLKTTGNKEMQIKFENATEQLIANRDVVERHLDEVNTISENSWNIDHTDRIHMHLMKARKELKLVRSDLLKE